MLTNNYFKTRPQLICLISFLATIGSNLAWQAVLDRTDVVIENHEVVYVNFTVFKINRTSFAGNVSINLLKDISSNIWMQIKLYGMYSNEYRELPFLVKRTLCEIFDFEYKFIENEIHGHFPNKCPIKKGNYYFNNFIPNAKYMPHNPWKISKYKLEFIFSEKTKIHAQIDILFHATTVDEYYKE